MRTRKSSLLLCIPLIAVLAPGCSDQGAPSSPDAKADQKAIEAPPAPPVKGTAKTPAKKPKDLKAFTGPARVAD
jgi:hypothetical protein